MEAPPLRKLPLELRLDIYERVFKAEDSIRVTLNKSGDETRLSLNSYNGQPHTLALRSACKQIAIETSDIVFKVNDSWTFVHMDDDSTAWGKRVRDWGEKAGAKCLQRARIVHFDIGHWDSRPTRYNQEGIAKLLYHQVGSMYQNLPKQLRQCKKHNYRIHITWSSGIKRAHGRRDRLEPLELVVPIWTDVRETRDSILSGPERAMDGLAKYDRMWYGLGESPSFYDPPQYERQLQRHIRAERVALAWLISDLAMASLEVFQVRRRARLDKYALDA